MINLLIECKKLIQLLFLPAYLIYVNCSFKKTTTNTCELSYEKKIIISNYYFLQYYLFTSIKMSKMCFDNLSYII